MKPHLIGHLIGLGHTRESAEECLIMTDAKKAGRPTTDPATHRGRATFTLSPQALRLVEQLAERTGQSKSAVVETAIRKLAEQPTRA